MNDKEQINKIHDLIEEGLDEDTFMIKLCAIIDHPQEIIEIDTDDKAREEGKFYV